MVATRYFDQRERFTDNPDVYSYDALPDEFRIKVGYALGDLYDFLKDKMSYSNAGLPRALWQRAILRALGVVAVPGGGDVFAYLYNEQNTSKFFIGVEVALLMSASSMSGAELFERDACKQRIIGTMEEINKLLRYYALGYEITVSKDEPLFQVIRKDSEFTHEEMVKPALRLLATDEFQDADKQFRDAHREFQQGNYDDAITDAAAAVETVLKVALRVDTGTAKDLLGQAADAGYFPSSLLDSTSHWVNLMLELATIRNKFGDAHGKGSTKQDDKELERLARLALNLAATHILFVVDEQNHRRQARA